MIHLDTVFERDGTDPFLFIPRLRHDEITPYAGEAYTHRLLLPVTDAGKCSWLHDFLDGAIRHIKSFEKSREVWRIFPRVEERGGACPDLLSRFKKALDSVNRKTPDRRLRRSLGACGALVFTPFRAEEPWYRFRCAWFDRFNLLVDDEKARNRNHPAEVVQANLAGTPDDAAVVLSDPDGLIFEEDFDDPNGLKVDTGGRPVLLLKPRMEGGYRGAIL